jgi:hypothetical protein
MIVLLVVQIFVVLVFGVESRKVSLEKLEAGRLAAKTLSGSRV